MKENTYRTIMMLGLYLGLLLFVIAIIALARNVEEIKTDPIIYGMEKHQYDRCQCFDQNSRMYSIVLEDFRTKKEVDFSS